MIERKDRLWFFFQFLQETEKEMMQKEKDSDIGEDAFVLAAKRGAQEGK